MPREQFCETYDQQDIVDDQRLAEILTSMGADWSTPGPDGRASMAHWWWEQGVERPHLRRLFDIHPQLMALVEQDVLQQTLGTGQPTRAKIRL